MALKSRDYIGVAEKIKSCELSAKEKIEQMQDHISELSGLKHSLKKDISSLEAELSAAYEDTDEEGEPDYDLIAYLESEINSLEDELADVKEDIDSSSKLLELSQNEYDKVLEEKSQTLFEIQERARTASQNISTASGMYGAYAGVGNTLQGSMQKSLSALAQAASILDGSIMANSSLNAINSNQGKGNIANGEKNIGEISLSPLAAFTNEMGETKVEMSEKFQNSMQFESTHYARETPGTLANFHLGKTKSNEKKMANYNSFQISNEYCLSSLSQGSCDTEDILANPSLYISSQNTDLNMGVSALETSDKEIEQDEIFRSDLESRRKWASQYKVDIDNNVNNFYSISTSKTNSLSKGQRQRSIVDEIEYEGAIQHKGYFNNNDYNTAMKDMKHFQENEEFYSYDDYSKKPKMLTVNPKTIMRWEKGNEKNFWEYKGAGSKERYVELASEISTVNFYHNIKGMSYEQISNLGGTLGACANQYFGKNAIRVEKVGNAYIFEGDGRHRLEAAILAGVENLPVLVVGEHKIKPIISGTKIGEKMSFDKANSGHVNPNYGVDVGYSTNCQSCVVVFEARLRGYDVQVLPNERGSMLDILSKQCNLAWIDPNTGKPPQYMFDDSLSTAEEYFQFIDKTIEIGNRYTIQFSWNGRGNSGHIVNLDRMEDGRLRIKDNQRGKGEKSEWIGNEEVLTYLTRMKYYNTSILGTKFPCVPKILRIDNMDFNEEIVNYIMEGVKNG